jgi:hypothetical protein
MSLSRGRFIATIYDLHEVREATLSDFTNLRGVYRSNRWRLEIYARNRSNLFEFSEGLEFRSEYADINRAKMVAHSLLLELFLEDMMCS